MTEPFEAGVIIPYSFSSHSLPNGTWLDVTKTSVTNPQEVLVSNKIWR
jgi:hypothetical protein